MTDIEIRHATPDDAQTLLSYVQEITSEPGLYLLTGPGEFKMTVDEERDFIQKICDKENSAIFLAVVGERIVGEIDLRGGRFRADRHSAMLGISVHQGWRGMGVGSRLMETALDWAREESPLQRIELHVIIENEPAIHLYRKFGFEVEGQRRRLIYREGRYLDDLIMAVWLKGPVNP
jgi:RimJ/RimL family protein N-acetyltransferase